MTWHPLSVYSAHWKPGFSNIFCAIPVSYRVLAFDYTRTVRIAVFDHLDWMLVEKLASFCWLNWGKGGGGRKKVVASVKHTILCFTSTYLKHFLNWPALRRSAVYWEMSRNNRRVKIWSTFFFFFFFLKEIDSSIPRLKSKSIPIECLCKMWLQVLVLMQLMISIQDYSIKQRNTILLWYKK